MAEADSAAHARALRLATVADRVGRARVRPWTRGRNVTPVLVRALLVFLGVLAGLALWRGPLVVAGHLNPTLPAPHPPAEGAALIHRTTTVVDLHADALLWDWPLLERRRTGHADLPRLMEGRVALQVFSVVTKVPHDVNVEANAADSDMITDLALLQLWPPRTWTSLLERALYQADKLRRAAGASRGRLDVLTSRDGLEAYLRSRADEEPMVAGVLSLEGAHALEGRLANVDRLFDAGFRVIGLTHFFDNEVGGSAHGLERGGLTPFGERVVERMQSLGMIVDLAHASPALVDDVVARARHPLVVSHTGVDGTCPSPRNLNDARLEAIAATGGVVGIGLWPEAVCGASPGHWARAVRYAVDKVGVDHVALGSDWDGAVPAIVDAAGTVHLTEALLAEGFEAVEVRKILGENALRVLREVLPEGRRLPPARAE